MVNVARHFLIMLKNLLQMHTSSKRVIQRTAKATGDLIDNKIADRIMKKLHMRMIKKCLKRDISAEKWHEVIDDLRFKW